MSIVKVAGYTCSPVIREAERGRWLSFEVSLDYILGRKEEERKKKGVNECMHT